MLFRRSQKQQPLAPAVEDQQRFVTLAYRAILAREPDAQGLQNYISALQHGLTPADLLQGLLDSQEYAQKTHYDYRQDAQVAPYLSDEVVQLSDALHGQKPVSIEQYDALWQQLFDLNRYQIDNDQRRYGMDHYQRFYELVNALSLLGVANGGKLLEFGPSQFTLFYKELFPKIQIHTADRPLPEDFVGFNAALSYASLGSEQHYRIDLNRSLNYAEHQQKMGQFDWILFTEVLEHLTVSPSELLAFLLSLLTENGRLYLTTPNFLRAENLALLSQRRNPQAYYPPMQQNEDAHHHVREFTLLELLSLATEVGAKVHAVYFSNCWDPAADEARTADQRGNMVLVLGT